MCDFRGPPKQIFDTESKGVFDVPFLGNLLGAPDVPGHVEFPPKESGFYYMCGTGCHYEYFDGQKFFDDGTWLHNFKDRSCSLEDYPERMKRYKFIWPSGEENHISCFGLTPRLLQFDF